MIMNLEDFSKEELIKMNKRAIEQITELIDENQKLKKAIKKACFENNIQYIRGLVNAMEVING